MMILVINAGSSSLKYQLFDMDHEKVLCKGNCERIGLEKSVIGHKTSDGKKIEKEVAMQNHKDAFMQVNSMLTDAEYGVIENASEIQKNFLADIKMISQTDTEVISHLLSRFYNGNIIETIAKTCSTLARTEDFSRSLRLIWALERVELCLL